MKRLYKIALALMAMAILHVPPSVFAQALNQPASTPDPFQLRGCPPELMRQIEGDKRFPYCWNNAGRDPVILKSELDRLNSDTVGYNEVELAGMIKGTYDNVTEKGHVPISRRLRKRVSLLLYHDPDKMTDADWNRIVNQIATGQIAETVVRAGSIEADTGMVYSATDPAVVTQYPWTPVDFNVRGYLLPGVKVDEGPYQGKTIQLFFTRLFEKEGETSKEPCVNISGFFSETPTFTSSTPPAPLVIPDVVAAAPPFEGFGGGGGGGGFWTSKGFWIPVAGLLGGLAIYEICKQGHEESGPIQREDVKGKTNPGGVPSVPGPGARPASTAAGLRVSFRF